MPFLEENYDVCVIGAGHAGCEAALSSARLGMRTIMFTVTIEGIALMPCNPNIGKNKKGHLSKQTKAPNHNSFPNGRRKGFPCTPIG